MDRHTVIAVDLQEAAELASLTGIRNDLETTLSLAWRLKGEFAKGQFDVDLDIYEALSTAVLVRYIRPFASGVRARLRKDALHVLTESQRQAHERLKNFRDKHVAHSVNAFEENQVVVEFSRERVREEGIQKVYVYHSRVVGLLRTDVEEIIDLAKTLLTYVKQRIKDEEARLLPFARALPLDDLLSRPPKARQNPPDNSKIASARRKP
jgi:hypothetical protein